MAAVLVTARPSLHLRSGSQQALVKAAEAAVRRDEMGLDDPIAPASERIWIAEPRGIGRADALMIALSRPRRVRKFADGVAGDLAAEDVAARRSGIASKRVEIGAGDVGRGARVCARG